jgi:acyl-CoA synthetase (AMP-forming)/AMP-acid ligase II/NAD(P)-dependent dehydrogenase (short-subunit alcohol dehydrogenase family)/acyl carrier protein
MKTALNKEALQLALNRHAEIIEAVAIIRQDVDQRDILVVYIVPAGVSLATASCFTLDDFLPEFQLQDFQLQDLQLQHDVSSNANTSARIVLLNAIPRLRDGSIDEDALTAMPVLEKGLMKSWSTAIQAIAGVEKLAVVNVLRHRKAGYLHRADVIGSAMGDELLSAAHPDNANAGASGATAQKSSVKAIVHAPGLSDVGVLTDQLDESYPLNLANTLYRAAKISPDKGIRYIDENGGHYFQTYPQLLKTAQQVLSGLQAQGLKAGDKVLLQCVDNRDFLAVFWASVLGGLVPVPISIAPSYTADNAVVQKLLNTWQMLDQAVIICSDRLIAAFDLLFESTPLQAGHVVSLHTLQSTELTEIQGSSTQPCPDDLALLLLTSGSTGTPKAVMHTHQTLINLSAAVTQLNKFDRDDVSLNWIPLDHVGGIVMSHLRDVYNASSQVQIATSRILEQPLRWLDIIDAERASITWAPNFAFALIVDLAAEVTKRSWDLECMRFMLNGGEAVVARTGRHFLQLLQKDNLPADAMRPAWGMSETASGVCYSDEFSIDTHSDSDGAVAVGQLIPNTSMRIVDENNQVLCEGEKGSLQIRGASITPGYFQNSEENQKAFTDDGWFDTGDAGILKDGRLTITARIKDEIIINGINYPAAELEVIVEAIEGVSVSYTAACAVRPAHSDTDAIAIFFCPTEEDDVSLTGILQTIQTAMVSDAGIKAEFIMPLSMQQIPKTNIGKIQRGLLKQQFEQGEFDENLKHSERLLGSNVIPDWFYRKNWYAKALSTASKRLNKQQIEPGAKYLIFIDDEGFTDALCERLNLAGARVITVSVANEYRCEDKYRYTINPTQSDHYSKLMTALQQADDEPGTIIHCWTYAKAAEIKHMESLRQAQYASTYSLLMMLQSLAAIKSATTDSAVTSSTTTNSTTGQAALYVVSNGVQQQLSEARTLNPHAAMLGLLKTAPLEFDWLTAQHIDFSYHSAPQFDQQVNCLLDEISCQSTEDEIVYRFAKTDGWQRYGWQLCPGIFQQDKLKSTPLKQGGIVLITGGLGGIGAYLARHLIKHYKAKCILLGRSVLPERDSWPAIQQQGGKLAERIKEYLLIEATGAEFVYRTADVADAEALQQIVKEVEQHWNDELNGVFHLAVGGDIGERWQNESAHTIKTESIDSFEEMFATKVYASWSLAGLVSQRKKSFMVSFGSVIGVFGAARYASYASAHTMLSQLTHHFNQANPGRFYQFDWAVWENIGLSRQEPKFAIDYYRSIGYSLIPADTGMDSLLAGLCQRQAELIIGLDGDKWPIRKHLPFEGQSLQKFVACFTANKQESDLESVLDKQAVGDNIYDQFHVPTQCEFMQLEQLPETAEGVPDIKALQTIIENEGVTEDEKPETEMDKQVAEYWCDLLHISSPGLHRSFFQLGGNSLSAMQLISRLKQRFNVQLEMRDLFDAATISDMTTLIRNRMEQSEQRPTEIKQQDDKKQDEMETGNRNVASMNAQELLANIDQLSEQQIAELLETMQQDGEA